MNDRVAPDREIALPFPEPPPPGETIEVAPGLLWARMPLPMRLNHVNVWLLEETDGWTAIDCGLDTPETRQAWERLLRGVLSGKPVRRLIATHGHVDHIGLAGWVVDRLGGVPFHATRAGWLWARVGYANSTQPTSAHALRFLEAHGTEPGRVAAFAKDRGAILRLFGPQPYGLHRIGDGQSIDMGRRRWRVIAADGHADEHASFASESDAILIAGDQILQRISPVVGVFAGEPLADSLTAYLDSLKRFAELPEDTLVLPSHGLPFYGLGARRRQLAEHHEVRLETVLDALTAPKTATECAHVLFARAMTEGHWYLALGETLAHLHRLVSTSCAARRENPDGRVTFERR